MSKKTTIELCQLVATRTHYAKISRDYFNTKEKQGASIAEMLAAASDCMNDYEALIGALSDLVNRLSGKDAEGGAE
jgi:hypothetical protein